MPRTKSAVEPERLSHDGRQYVLESALGRTTVEEAVVSKLASMAAREVDGVHELVPFDTSQRLSSVALNAVGRPHRGLGVQVLVGTVEAIVDVHLIADSHVPIPALAEALRANITERVEHATGLHLKQVNVSVLGLAFPETAPLAPPDDAAAELQ